MTPLETLGAQERTWDELTARLADLRAQTLREEQFLYYTYATTMLAHRGLSPNPAWRRRKLEPILGRLRVGGAMAPNEDLHAYVTTYEALYPPT